VKGTGSSDPGFDASLLASLACPACHGDLRSGNAHLVCVCCHRAYPVIDAIPVLIVERAETDGQTRESNPL